MDAAMLLLISDANILMDKKCKGRSLSFEAEAQDRRSDAVKYALEVSSVPASH
jgi:hypothetical protein